MSSRLSCAILALAAATLLAISIASSAWWAGHPVSPTKTYTQIAHVGLHGAELCLVDQAALETCKSAPTHSVFGPVGYAELVACILLVVSSVGLCLLTLRRSEDRKTFAVLAIGGALLADVLAFALIAIGPTSEAAIPYGYGLYLFFTGSTLAIVAGALARRAIAPLVLAPARQPQFPAPVPMPPSQQQPVIDMAALMRDDPLRPSSPEPMLGSRPAPPPSPGGVLPGPAGPLGAPSESQPPLFQSAPQLRPLYEMQGNTPIAPPPKFPPRAPTPLPREKIAIATGQQTPPAPTPYAPQPKQSTIPPPFSRAPVAPMAKPITVPPPVAKPSTGGSRPLPKVGSGPSSARMPAVVPIPAVIPPTPPPLEPPAGATDPGGYAAVGDAGVGDSTDVNVPIQTPPPQVDATSPNVAIPRAETNDDLETIAREKVSMTEIEVKPAEPKVPISTAPESLPPPVEKRAQSSGPSPACPQCEAPMAWVEEHLRFYCKSCRMYF